MKYTKSNMFGLKFKIVHSTYEVVPPEGRSPDLSAKSVSDGVVYKGLDYTVEYLNEQLTKGNWTVVEEPKQIENYEIY